VHVSKLDYSVKYRDRQSLEKLYGYKKNCDDILIIRDGLVTDSYYANVAFEKDGLWFTPSIPLLKGTHRQALLDNEILFTKNIQEKDISSFNRCRLFNAMINFGDIEFPTSNIY